MVLKPIFFVLTSSTLITGALQSAPLYLINGLSKIILSAKVLDLYKFWLLDKSSIR